MRPPVPFCRSFVVADGSVYSEDQKLGAEASCGVHPTLIPLRGHEELKKRCENAAYFLLRPLAP